jgi:dephospho-CoA kinase
MLKVGITGGIGSGKTTICKIFEILGIPVFYADDVSKTIMVDDLELKSQIINFFGSEAYFSDGSLNRKYISDIVFKDDLKLKKLNSLVHPAVRNAYERWASSQKSPYVLKEAALMFESKSYLDNNLNVLVSCPLDLRIERVISRDKTTKEKVLDRISKQMPEEEKEKLADFKIINDEEKSLIKQVLFLHNELLHRSRE